MATISSIGFAATVGGIAGASLAAHRGARSTAGAALLGAVGLGTSEAVARARQKEGEIPALWQRIAVSTAMAAPLGWVAGQVTNAGPRTVGTATGAVSYTPATADRGYRRHAYSALVRITNPAGRRDTP